MSHFTSALKAITIRDILGKYRKSSLGLLWAVIQPLALMTIFNVFRLFVGIPSSGLPYVIFVYSALVPWTFLTNAISGCGQSITENAEVIRRIALPRQVFPLSAIVRALFDFSMAAVVLAGMMAWYRVSPTPMLLWLPVLIAIMVGLAYGVGLPLAALGTFNRDFVFAAPFLLQIWMFLTPVIYPLSSVPNEWRSVYILNPMVGVIEGFRNTLLLGKAPPTDALTVSLVWALALIPMARFLFNRLSDYFADVM